MEVKITKHGGSQFMLTFDPKGKDDEKMIQEMAKAVEVEDFSSGGIRLSW